MSEIKSMTTSASSHPLFSQEIASEKLYDRFHLVHSDFVCCFAYIQDFDRIIYLLIPSQQLEEFLDVYISERSSERAWIGLVCCEKPIYERKDLRTNCPSGVPYWLRWR